MRHMQLAREAEGLGLDLDAAQALGALKVIQTVPGVLAQELTAHDGMLMAIRLPGRARILRQ